MVEPTVPSPELPKKSGVSCVVIGLCVAGGGIVLLGLLAALLLPAVTKAGAGRSEEHTSELHHSELSRMPSSA